MPAVDRELRRFQLGRHALPREIEPHDAARRARIRLQREAGLRHVRPPSVQPDLPTIRPVTKRHAAPRHRKRRPARVEHEFPLHDDAPVLERHGRRAARYRPRSRHGHVAALLHLHESREPRNAVGRLKLRAVVGVRHRPRHTGRERRPQQNGKYGTDLSHNILLNATGP